MPPMALAHRTRRRLYMWAIYTLVGGAIGAVYSLFIGGHPKFGFPIGCAIVGGGVYRGEAIPELNGHYFFADYCLGWVRSFVYADGQVTQFHDWQDDFGRLGTVSSFGTDASGELYVTNLQGEIWRLDRASDS